MTRCTTKKRSKFRFYSAEWVNNTATLSADEYYLINIKIG